MAGMWDVIGHERQRRELSADLDSGNVSHAYLFTGPAHIGKTALALWFARQLLLQGVETPERRELVEQQIARLLHPDLFVLDQLWIEDVCEDWNIIAQSSNIPQGHRSKKPAMKTDTISVDDIRALQERLQETGLGTYRCCILCSVERMQDPAANAFLKMLEEPPQGLVFLLTAQNPDALLPTVVSRCRVLRCAPLRRAELRPLLEGVPEEDAAFMLAIARGAPGIICTLRENPDLLRSHRLLHTAAHAFWQSSNLRSRLQLLKPLEERGASADDMLLHLALTLREQHAPKAAHVRAFASLVRNLETHAHRGILTQQFALALDDPE